MKKKIIGFILGVFSLGIVSSAQADRHSELKLAPFQPPKEF